MKSNTFFKPKKSANTQNNADQNSASPNARLSSARGQFSIINIARAGILTSIALVLNFMFLAYVPVAGMNAIKITFAPPFAMLTGIICGPVMGLFSGALIDLLPALIKPVGAYFPGFTISSALTALMVSLMYKHLKNNKINYNILNMILIVILSIGFVAAFVLKQMLIFENGSLYFNGSPLSIWIILGFLALVIAYIIVPIIITSKFKFKVRMDKILFIVSVTQFVFSIIINTYFLSILFGKGYLAFLPGRIIASFFTIPMYTFILAAILEIAEKMFKFKSV
jgi:ECF transporter S component (folate family)